MDTSKMAMGSTGAVTENFSVSIANSGPLSSGSTDHRGTGLAFGVG